jgi:adenine-specific DNA-methyltransferase
VIAATKAEEIREANGDLREFEETMYGDIWRKEDYLNWMYERLLAIREVMSETASIYVHLDWHIGHYVKILMDEIFGEENFRREIIWNRKNPSGGKAAANNYIHVHDNLYFYTRNQVNTFNKEYEEYSKAYVSQRFNQEDKNGKYRIQGKDSRKQYLEDSKGLAVTSVWEISDVNVMSSERADYATQKPEALLERIIKASSDEGMIVADFFGGSGVTAKVAHGLGRQFITSDVGINSVQTMRDRLLSAGASFDVVKVRDGVSLFRNPAQTMDKLRTILPGLTQSHSFGKYWFGGMTHKKSSVPVWVPDLYDRGQIELGQQLMYAILSQAAQLEEVPDAMILYYISLDEKGCKEAIKIFVDQNNFINRHGKKTEFVFRDLKDVLDMTVTDDQAVFSIEKVGKKHLVNIQSFVSETIQNRINEYLQKKFKKTVKNLDGMETSESVTDKIRISEKGLELIEMVSVDCSENKGEVWQSDSEIKIDGKTSYLVVNGNKTKTYWDGTIECDNEPKCIKIRNIAGDETVFVV